MLGEDSDDCFGMTARQKKSLVCAELRTALDFFVFATFSRTEGRRHR
jgi:hypothetical protein